MLGIAPRAPRPLRVGLWGRGKVGGQIDEQFQAGAGGNVQVVGVLVRTDSPELRATAAGLGAQPCTSLAALLALQPEVVLEAATAEALAELGPRVLEAGVDLVALSPVCLLDSAVQERFRQATSGGGRLMVPGGSAEGIELLRAVRFDGLRSVRLDVFWKPSAEFPYSGQGELQELFAGSAREAGLKYPRNANFIVTLGLGGLGLDRTEVRVLLDPKAENTHYQLEAIADGGELRLAVQLRRPSGRSGRLAALSGVETIRQLSEGGVAQL
jgi:aspartate dehydrogenase